MFQLDVTDRKSIYEQIVDNFKELIVTGVLAPKDKLPSVRELAKMLTVNPNTIQKAYRELDNQGWIYTVSGLGCFVSEGKRPVDRLEVGRLIAEIVASVRELTYLGIDEEEILTLISEAIRERREGK